MSFRVIQITDCHLFADKRKVVGEGVLGSGIASFETLASVLESIPKHRPDLVLVTGDLSADESNGSYQHFKNLWRDLKVDTQLKVIPGNHDNAQLMKENFPQLFWQKGVIDAGGWKLHCLHSQIPGQGKGEVSDEQLTQLQLNIDCHPNSRHFIAVHHHPIAMNSWMDNYNWINKQAFVHLVERNEVIKIVMHGHVHTCRDIPIGQARLITTPSTCWQFKHEAEFAFDLGSPAFRVVELHPDGTFDTSVIFVE
jgi:Icc protein